MTFKKMKIVVPNFEKAAPANDSVLVNLIKSKSKGCKAKSIEAYPAAAEKCGLFAAGRYTGGPWEETRRCHPKHQTAPALWPGPIPITGRS